MVNPKTNEVLHISCGGNDKITKSQVCLVGCTDCILRFRTQKFSLAVPYREALLGKSKPNWIRLRSSVLEQCAYIVSKIVSSIVLYSSSPIDMCRNVLNYKTDLQN